MGRKQFASSEPEYASWGEAIKAYQTTHTTRAFPDDAYAKPARVTRYAKSREEVEYNPVLQTFTDGGREAAARDVEVSSRVTRLNHARDVQIARESPFNILTMADKRCGARARRGAAAAAAAGPKAHQQPSEHRETPTFRHPLDSCYQYNIVSGLPLSVHHYAPPELRPKITEHEPPSTSLLGAPMVKPKLQTVTALPRDFNILSNKYRHNHDAKMEVEKEIQKRTAAVKYWETHDYDLFSTEYLDPAKEAHYQGVAAKEAEEQPMKAFYAMPPGYQRSEGYVYDITTHDVKNKDLYAKAHAKEQAFWDGKKATHARDTNIRQKGVDRQDLEAQRAINRFPFKKYEEAFQHGYSIVDGRDYGDPNTSAAAAAALRSLGAPPPPAPPPPPAQVHPAAARAAQPHALGEDYAHRPPSSSDRRRAGRGPPPPPRPPPPTVAPTAADPRPPCRRRRRHTPTPTVLEAAPPRASRRPRASAAESDCSSLGATRDERLATRRAVRTGGFREAAPPPPPEPVTLLPPMETMS